MGEETDQQALNAAIERFGVDKWWGGWQEHDIALYHKNGKRSVGALIQPTIDEGGVSPWEPLSDHTPEAGTWAVGRLIEEMGERFRGLNKTLSGRFCVNVSGPGSRSSKRTEYYPTPLQALIAAQTAILENTLEAIGDPVRDSNLRNRAIAIELKALGRGKGGKP